MYFRAVHKSDPKSFIHVTFLQIPGPPGETSGLFRAHSVTGRKGLYSPAGSIVAIDGLETAAAHRLVRRLKLHAINEGFCYRHRYRPGDILMWDNSATLHYATPIGRPTTNDQHRLLYRIVPLGLPRALRGRTKPTP